MYKSSHWRLLGRLPWLLSVMVPGPSCAKLAVNPLFSEDAVLQRDSRLPVWGDANPGDTVAVEFAGQHRRTAADREGRWRVTLDPMPADSVGRTLTITAGNERLELRDIAVGDVWLCAGQSNMQAWVAGTDVEPAIPKAASPELRAFPVDVEYADTPQRQFRQGTPGMVLAAQREKLDQYGLKWTVASPETAPWFSAVAYSFARRLYEETGVPVGLITAALGGTPAADWIPREALKSHPDLRSLVSGGSSSQQNRPAGLFNGSIAPLIPLAIKGVVWYQGESDAGSFTDAVRYRRLLPTLIRSWRHSWKTNLPFVVVQLPGFHAREAEPSDSPWTWVRDAQLWASRTEPNVGLAVTIDSGLADNLHPPAKAAIGERAARAALSAAYGRPSNGTSPTYRAYTIHGSEITVQFSNAGEGLETHNVVTNGDRYRIGADPIKGFAICGADRKFVWADAVIVGRDRVVVYSPQVPRPIAVRYAWGAFPSCNLYNSESLPASPFRTDDFAPPGG